MHGPIPLLHYQLRQTSAHKFQVYCHFQIAVASLAYHLLNFLPDKLARFVHEQKNLLKLIAVASISNKQFQFLNYTSPFLESYMFPYDHHCGVLHQYQASQSRDKRSEIPPLISYPLPVGERMHRMPDLQFRFPQYGFNQMIGSPPNSSSLIPTIYVPESRSIHFAPVVSGFGSNLDESKNGRLEQWNSISQKNQEDFSMPNRYKRKNSEVDRKHDKGKKRMRDGTHPSHHNSPPHSEPSLHRKIDDQEIPKVVYSRSGDGCERITEAIVEYYNKQHQSEVDLRHKIVLSNCLYAIVRDVFPGCRLFIVGSSLNGFGTKTSDMDLCLLLSQIESIDQRNEAIYILTAIHKALRCCKFVRSSQVIKAKVPILKFVDAEKNIECDLNINNGIGIRNTHLLKYYCMADPRVGPLMLFIKHWARFHDINDAHKRSISSYSFALMLVHYLQCGCSPPVLPNLQKLHPNQFSLNTDLYTLRLDESFGPYHSENRDSLGKLFVGFLHYYAFSFSPATEAISIRRGETVPVHKVRQQTGDVKQWKCLCVEEPFDLSNTARSVFDPYIFQRIMQVFRRSATTLKENGDVRSILTQPF